MSDKNKRLAKLDKSPNLPSPPQIAVKILELDKDPDAGLSEITSIVESDPAIAAQVLKFANSPLSGLTREIKSVRQATTLIGGRTTKLIALSFSLLKTKLKGIDFDIERFWQRSIGVGASARNLTLGRDGAPETAFVTGLLSRLGWLLVRCVDSKSFNEILSAGNTDADIQSKAIELYGKSLYEIGADTLEKWGFPDDISSVIRETGNFESSDNQAAKILYLGLNMAEMLNESEVSVSVDVCRGIFSQLEQASGDFDLGFDEIYEQVGEDYVEYLNLMDISVPELRELWEVEQQAKQAVTSLGLEAEQHKKELEEKNRLLTDEAQTDQLTGLKNRRAFELRATEEVDRALRNGRELGIMVIDIDKFKTFNDTHGHLVGDAVLAQVGQKMEEVIRKYDSVYRYGGEEFVILVPECRFGDVLSVGDRVRSSIEDLRVTYEEKTLAVTISIGVSFINGSMKTTWNEMFEEADQYLYKAKENGRNQVCADPNLPRTVTAPCPKYSREERTKNPTNV